MYITKILYSTVESPTRGIYIEFHVGSEIVRLDHIEDIEFVRQPVHSSFAQQQGLVGQVYYDTWKFRSEQDIISIFITDGMTQGVLEHGPRRIVIELQSTFKSILSGVYDALQFHFDVEDSYDDDKENEP